MKRTRLLGALGLCLVVGGPLLRAEPRPVAPPLPPEQSSPENLPAPLPVPVPADSTKPEKLPGKEADNGQKDSEESKSCPTPFALEMIGDQTPTAVLSSFAYGMGSPPSVLAGTRFTPAPGSALVIVPGTHNFKISENESPQPQDRNYLIFNYDYNLYGASNRHAEDGIRHIRTHSEIFGWEWAAPDKESSFGIRLPLNTFNSANAIPGLDGTSTDLGDVSFIFKQVAWQDPDTHSLVSGGLAITPPTGPGAFAGSNHLGGFRNCGLQPFAGYLWNVGDFYVHGFLAFDIPTDPNDVTLLSNDLGIGFLLLHNPDTREFLTTIAPTLEVHANTPLNHRGGLRLDDQAATADTVNLTAGMQFEFFDHTRLAVGCAVPVTGPRPFDFEIHAHIRCHY